MEEVKYTRIPLTLESPPNAPQPQFPEEKSASNISGEEILLSRENQFQLFNYNCKFKQTNTLYD